jgi:beta-lactamase class A
MREAKRQSLQRQIAQIGREAGAEAVAAAFYDYETDTSWSYHGDRWFHAASTVKVAVLAVVFRAVEEGFFQLSSRVHVRNRFLSLVDGEPYRVPTSRDANSKVHASLGRTMNVQELAFHMIVTSSNLATNLLLDLVGLDRAAKFIQELKLEGISLMRGVEDDKAFEAGINNTVTASGLISLFRAIQDERGFTHSSSQQMLSILNQQEFNGGIPAGLPSNLRSVARIAHKTGEISTVAHDAGIVSIPRRKPYAVAILTQWPENGSSSRLETVARISKAIYIDLNGTDTEMEAGTL